MAEVAGLVLGGIPIAIWALGKSVDSVDTAIHYRSVITTFKADLKLQQQQLQLTLANIGLPEASTKELKEHFEQEYPDIADDLLTIIQRMEDAIADLLRNLEIDIHNKVRPYTDIAWPPSRNYSQYIGTTTGTSASSNRSETDSNTLTTRPPQSKSSEAGPETRKPMSTELANLCAQIRQKCDTWTVSGFLRDPESVGESELRFALSHVPGGPSSVACLTLKSLIASQQQPGLRRALPHLTLSAKERCGIAAGLAWLVLHLSGSPWLGERWAWIQAKMLVEKPRGGREELSRYPCLSCHLPCPPEQALPDKDAAAAGADRAKDLSRYIPNKPVVQLGILLVELCLNQSLADFQTAEAPAPSSLVDDCSVAESMLDEVRLIAGESYGNAAERCIKFVFRGIELRRHFDYPEFRRDFYEAVAPVQARYMMS